MNKKHYLQKYREKLLEINTNKFKEILKVKMNIINIVLNQQIMTLAQNYQGKLRKRRNVERKTYVSCMAKFHIKRILKKKGETQEIRFGRLIKRAFTFGAINQF
jgi:hypothetical protein